MKVVFATEYYHPWAPGGTAWSLELLARALIARGHGVTVVTPNYGGPAREEINGVPVVRFPFWRRLRPGAGLSSTCSSRARWPPKFAGLAPT